jgi:sec-independent protein translocase protein TatA
MGLSLNEILLIFVVILLLFGAKKLPELARSLGRASYEFKKAKEDILKETRELADASEKAAEQEDNSGK